MPTITPHHPPPPQVPLQRTGLQRRVARSGERLRLGLTGLGAIFLIVMVVAAGLKPAPQAIDRGVQGEALAVLGVAPGAVQPDAATPTP